MRSQTHRAGRRPLALLAAAAFALSACSATATATGSISASAQAPTPAAASGAPSAAAAGPGAVSIADFAFAPGTITVAPGTTVTWTNNDTAAHTVTADDGSFDSKSLATGGSFSRLMDTAGTYSYHCAIHSSMTATVIVK